MTDIIVANTNKDSKKLQNAVCGETFEAFVQSQKATDNKRGLSDVGAYNLRASTSDILEHCNPHNATASPETTHLVVGYVQSGKTMSFTGVLAMARDNGYRLAIVLTGITNNLLNQTTIRLEKDLNLNEDDDWFKFYSSPTPKEASTIIRSLRLSSKPTIVIPILKHRKHIDNVTKLLKNEEVKKTLKGEAVLIIDDEADQASLNSYGYKNSKITDPNEVAKESATYGAIHRLRAELPGNTYIQYTATPQANILIATADILSPKSHTLLTPGEDYVGGKKFFGQEKNGDLFKGKLVKPIPDNEVYHKKKNALTSIPNSLKEALMMHVWAVVLVIKWYKKKGIKQLTMMVHPTDIIAGNQLFEGWVRHEIDKWSEALNKPEGHEDRVILMQRFEQKLNDALEFYPQTNRPSFNDVKKFIPDIVNDCAIYRITGESEDDGKNLPWNAHKMNVVIGAQMLNRGFTVEKLATTYMPRYTTGIANADTIEQRCRFFGYKMDYIESCRVYLPKESIDDYINYVKHEEELRSLLASCSSLKEYEHLVMLAPGLRPTRYNVLPKKLVSTKFANWLTFDCISESNLQSNKLTVSQFTNDHLATSSDIDFINYKSSKYDIGDFKKHAQKILTIKDKDKDNNIIKLLTDYMAGNLSDAISKSLVIRYLQYLKTLQPEMKVMIIFMSCDKPRMRSLQPENKDESRSVQLFQGPSKIGEKDKYIGDRSIYSKEFITIQIHHLEIADKKIKNEDYETYGLAIHFPENLKTLYYSSLPEDFDIMEE